MSATLEEQTLAALRRIEPVLARIEHQQVDHGTRLTRIEARLDATLPTLATKEEMHKLGFDLTWRFLGLLGVILLGYLGAIWWVVTLTLRAHGVTG